MIRSLDYFKSSSGFDLIPNMESVSLLGCLQWVKSCIEQHTKQGIQIIIEPMDDKISHKVRTDKQWLLENMLCLVSNSVKYTCYDGKVSMRVSLKTSVDNKSYLQFEVEDNGVGITVDKMVTLFQPSVRPRHSTGGTGLGLYALRSRTKALGGECGGGNRRDGGSGMLIWFTIPYHPDHSVEATAELVYEDIEANEAISSDVVHILPGEKSINRRILVVDDSIIIQKTTSRLLHNMGYEADVANNGTECLQRLKQQKYILVLMDIEMPVMNGIEAIQRIRADEATCALGSQITKNLKKQFVIGFSANSDAEMRDIALKAGMNDFMEKPLDISTLKKRCLLHKIVL